MTHVVLLTRRRIAKLTRLTTGHLEALAGTGTDGGVGSNIQFGNKSGVTCVLKTYPGGTSHDQGRSVQHHSSPPACCSSRDSIKHQRSRSWEFLGARARAGRRNRQGKPSVPDAQRQANVGIDGVQQRHAPGHRNKILSRIESMRGGKLYNARWGVRMKGEGIFAEQIKALSALAKRKAGFPGEVPELSAAAFRVPTNQLSLF